MNEKPVAIFISPVLPLPGGSGRALRAWDWLQALAREYRVHLIVPGADADWPPIPLDYPAERIWPLRSATAPTRGVYRLVGLWLPFLARYSRRLVTDWQQPTSVTALDFLVSHLAEEPVRRIVVFRLYLHEIGEVLSRRFPAAAIDLDLDDLESSTRLSVAGAAWRIGHYRESVCGLSVALQYRVVERTLKHRYRTLYLAAEEDCRRMSNTATATVECRANRIAVSDVHPPVPAGGELGLLFVGTLNYPPNAEAARVLVQELVPELAARLERPWRLRIVGRHASPVLTRLLQTTPHVEFLPDVQDLAACYAATHVVLVPLRSGGGTKFKTLEGLAHRRPVVSSRHGVRGLKLTSGEHFLLAETADEFASAVLHLGSHPEAAERIAAAGWARCWEQYRTP
ncbi:glycosyltransferase family 4 protein [Pseudomonas stutzeri]|uniref:Glycosyltransferase n=1 Tax=Stutzerimonas stutzeri TaxID=316 RepID=A0A2N8RXU8_STUST|nr:glycosyltransferase [Stutzerimonas stutzeri]MCQ4296213.1 glycosyltransferase family 4 protein [Stutzerimonas stutzeri]PNF79201.1 hypothetical protein CXK92_16910 [Stutzerimonas stutzeri]